MNGSVYKVPYGMLFKKYYCSKCGTKLERERTHRIVTKDDWDYYQYHDAGTFPRRDYDVFEYRFKCPSCESRISLEEQRVIERIQKRHQRLILSSFEIKQSYEEEYQGNNKKILLKDIVASIVFSCIFCIFCYFFQSDRTLKKLPYILIIVFIVVVTGMISTIRTYKGNYKLKYKRSYSYEKEYKMKRLQAYSSHNKKLIDMSNQCYCFYCKDSIDKLSITDYADNGQTAICPKCRMTSIIPDSIEETIDEKTILELNEYWF